MSSGFPTATNAQKLRVRRRGKSAAEERRIIGVHLCGETLAVQAACPLVTLEFRGELSRLPETLYPFSTLEDNAYSNTARVR